MDSFKGEQQSCPCCKECKDFRKLVELEDLGLAVYCHRSRAKNFGTFSMRRQGENVGGAVKPLGDVFILYNKKDVKVTTSELTAEFGKKNISCPRCRKTLQHAQKLMQELKLEDRTSVTAICDHCRKRSQSIKKLFCACDEIAKKFISIKDDQNKFGYIRTDAMQKEPNEPHGHEKVRIFTPNPSSADSDSSIPETYVEVKELLRRSVKDQKREKEFEDVPSIDEEGSERRHGLSMRLMMRPGKNTGVPYSVSEWLDGYETTKTSPWKQKETISKYNIGSDTNVAKIPTKTKRNINPCNSRDLDDPKRLQQFGTLRTSHKNLRDSHVVPTKFDKYNYAKTLEKDEKLKLQRSLDIISHKPVLRPSFTDQKREEIFEDIPSMDAKEVLKRRRDLSMELGKDVGVSYSVSKRHDIYDTSKSSPREQKKTIPKYNLGSDMDRKKIPTPTKTKTKPDIGAGGTHGLDDPNRLMKFRSLRTQHKNLQDSHVVPTKFNKYHQTKTLEKDEELKFQRKLNKIGHKPLPRLSHTDQKREELFEDITSIDATEELERRRDLSMRLGKDTAGTKYNMGSDMDVKKIPMPVKTKTKQDIGIRYQDDPTRLEKIGTLRTPQRNLQNSYIVPTKLDKYQHIKTFKKDEALTSRRSSDKISHKPTKIEQLVTKSKSGPFETVGSGLMPQFSFIFPKAKENEEMHVDLGVTSSELITDTQEKYRLIKKKQREVRRLQKPEQDRKLKSEQDRESVVAKKHMLSKKKTIVGKDLTAQVKKSNTYNAKRKQFPTRFTTHVSASDDVAGKELNLKTNKKVHDKKLPSAKQREALKKQATKDKDELKRETQEKDANFKKESQKVAPAKKTSDFSDETKVPTPKIQKSFNNEENESSGKKIDNEKESNINSFNQEPSKDQNSKTNLELKKKEAELISEIKKANKKRLKKLQPKEMEELKMRNIKIKNESNLNNILDSVRIKQTSKSMPEHVENKQSEQLADDYPLCLFSDLESDYLSFDMEKPVLKQETDIIIGENIFKFRPRLEKTEEPDGVPLFFQKDFFVEPDDDFQTMAEKQIIPKHKKPARVKILESAVPKKILEEKKTGSGIIHYALSDRTFIEKGWTILPTEKVVRKLNVYRMRPSHPEFDWFEHNKAKGLMTYDTGQRLADFDDNGRGRLYYRSGRLALDYYDAEEKNVQQRFVVYSSGDPDERDRTHPITILASFDYQGSGIVYDHAGKIRLKYNQTEGQVLDRALGPMSHWKWHSLNDPPVLQQVMIDTQVAHKDPYILQLGPRADENTPPKNEEMLALEFEHFVKEKKKKLSQKFKPFQIRTKALKINEHFSLKVLNQATVYLIFRDGSTNIKLNIGMLLDHHEIVDTDTTEVGEVANSLQRFPARTDSLAILQNRLARAQRYDRQRTGRELRLRPPVPEARADKLSVATSRPMRPPLRTIPIVATESPCNTGQCSRKPTKTYITIADSN